MHVYWVCAFIYCCWPFTIRRDFEGGIFWDELTETCGDISKAAGCRGVARFWGKNTVYCVDYKMVVHGDVVDTRLWLAYLYVRVPNSMLLLVYSFGAHILWLAECYNLRNVDTCTYNIICTLYYIQLLLKPDPISQSKQLHAPRLSV